MTRYSTSMSEILSQIREGFSPKEIKMAIGIAADKRYRQGNYSGAVRQIEKIKKGLSDHPQVAAVLKRLNTDFDPELKEEPASPDEGSMAVQQLEFMMHAVERMKEHIDNGGEFPEWMQNKLSGAHEKLKGLYANINHDNVQDQKESKEPIQWPSQPLEEELDLDEMKMDDPKLVKAFDKMKKGDTIKLKTSSTISKGKDFVDYVVKAKNVVNKGRVEKITLVTKGNEGAVKKFLYKRDGKVTFAIGDMGASIDDIKEGTWALPTSAKAKAELQKLMSKPIKLGKEGDDASDKLYALIGDDELFDDLYVAGKKNPNGDARDIVKKHMKRLGIKEEVMVVEAMMNLKLVTYQAKEALGKIRHKVAQKGGKYIISVDSNDEEDAQKAMKNHPLYVAGKLRVVPESVELEEKLKVSDGLGAWIDDFKKSDAPQFDGKSDEEKKNMAIAAFTDAGGKLEQKEETELDEAPKMKYALVGKDMKIYSMGSDERDLKLDRRSLEQRFKDAAPLKLARLKTAQSIGDKVDKSQLKEEEKPANDQAKKVDQSKEDQKKTRIAQLQLQIAKAQEMINKINRATEIDKMRKGE